jgi:Mn-dependent DtxR family transcriptional regulator
MKIKSFSIDELSMVDNDEKENKIEKVEDDIIKLNEEDEEVLKNILVSHEILEEFYETMKEHTIDIRGDCN